MSGRDAYKSCMEHLCETGLLQATARLLVWDRETLMPKGGPGAPSVPFRGRQMGQLARLIHERNTDARIGEWLAACEADDDLVGDPHSDTAVNVREARRDYDRATKLPASLVEQISKTTTAAHHAWAEARKSNDFKAFQPHLEKVVTLSRQKAECLSVVEGDLSPDAVPAAEPWDALADDLEPGLRAADVEALFTPLREELSSLVESLDAIVDPLDGLQLPNDSQRVFCCEVALAIGYDIERGAFAEATHPFCMGIHRNDVRITSRYAPTPPFESLYSMIHEAGHAIYNQNTPDGEAADLPLGEPRGFAIHESQSRMIENQIGRSREFWKWCTPIAKKHFAPALDTAGGEDLYRTNNRFRPSLIRVEADELTYNLHIAVRFELERAMIRGELSVGELPGAWNDAYKQYLGVDVPDDRRGCLQDVHWSEGLFGYFPTYTLGNLYAAQLFDAARENGVGTAEQIERGEFRPLIEWLIENIHRHGKRYSAEQLCEKATGSKLSSEPFLKYIRGKVDSICVAA